MPSSDEQSRPAHPPQVVHYARPLRRLRRPVGFFRTLTAVAVLSGLAFLSWQRLNERTAPPPRAAKPRAVATAPPPPAPAAPVEDPRDRVIRIYRADIVPMLDAYDARNRGASNRAIATLRDRIDARRHGIKPFIDDVQSWRTTFGVLGRKSRDTWRKMRGTRRIDGSVQQYVDEKFQRRILSPGGLIGDVDAALDVFREDVEASRNQLYTEMRLPLRGIKVDQVQSKASFAAFVDDVRFRSLALSTEGSHDAVTSNLTAFAAGWVAGEVGAKVAGRVVMVVVARVSTQLATRAAVSGGATVAGAAGGGGAGSTVGPAGTVVGIAVGIVVGAAIDWWMSEKFEAKMTTELNTFLTDLERSMVEGNASQPGLRKSFQDALDANSKVQRDAIISTLLQEADE